MCWGLRCERRGVYCWSVKKYPALGERAESVQELPGSLLTYKGAVGMASINIIYEVSTWKRSLVFKHTSLDAFSVILMQSC